MEHSRRTFLKQVSSAALGTTGVFLFSPRVIDEIEAATETIAFISPKVAARDEEYWSLVRTAFSPSPDFINLENGYFSLQPVGVMESFFQNTRMINEKASIYMRKNQTDDRTKIKKLLADFAGCSPDEIVINRNTTEALDTMINGLDLKAGDEAVMTNQDYGSMLAAFEQQGRRYGIVNKIISLPLHPENDGEIVSAFERAITAKTKVVLVTHMINITGQILPVRKICDAAHTHGVDVIVDAAHSFAHVEFKIPDLHCDYFGTSLHKWLCTPLGLGMMYIKKEKIKNVWPLFGDVDYAADDIRKFEHIGTHPCASVLTIGNALRFHDSIGSKRKEERLRYLKNYWTEKVRTFPKIRINTPLEDERTCAIANVAIEGKTPNEIVEYLFTKHKIFTVAIDTAAVKGVRITPHLYTTLNELDLLVRGMEELCAS